MLSEGLAPLQSMLHVQSDMTMHTLFTTIKEYSALMLSSGVMSISGMVIQNIRIPHSIKQVIAVKLGLIPQ